MANERKLTVVLAGDAKGMKRALDDATRATGGLGSKLGGLAKTAGLAFAGLGVGAVVLGKGFVDAAVESQKVTKQTEAVLKSMGDVAGVTAQDVASMSEKLSMQSGVDDELIQSSQNVLLTFGKVRNSIGKNNKIFDRATAAALDMSVALGTDMQGATIQVGKALNDPIKGITALSRAGVSFTQQQKDQIKWMVASGDTLGAQKIILKELENQFGGSAAAQATAGDKLKVIWGNLQEDLGMKLLPIVEKVAGWLSQNLPAALDTLGRWITPVTDQIGLFWGALTTGMTEDEGTPIESVALAIRDAFEALKTWWDENGETIKTTIGGVVGNIADTLKSIGTTIKDEVLPRLKDFAEWLFKDGPGMEIAIAGIAAAMAAYAASSLVAAGATIAATWPFIAFAAIVGGAAWATQELVDKFDLLEKGTEGLQWFIDNVLVPMKNAIRTIVDGLEDMLALLDKLPSLPTGGGGGGPIPIPLPGPADDFINSLFRADGGPVSGGRPYIVGERGPELFVPGGSGAIVPNESMGGIVQNFYGPVGMNEIEASTRELRRIRLLAGA